MRKREEKRKENKEIQTKNRDESGEGCVCALKCERWKKMSEVKKEERKKERKGGGGDNVRGKDKNCEGKPEKEK